MWEMTDEFNRGVVKLVTKMSQGASQNKNGNCEKNVRDHVMLHQVLPLIG